MRGITLSQTHYSVYVFTWNLLKVEMSKRNLRLAILEDVLHFVPEGRRLLPTGKLGVGSEKADVSFSEDSSTDGGAFVPLHCAFQLSTSTSSSSASIGTQGVNDTRVVASRAPARVRAGFNDWQIFEKVEDLPIWPLTEDKGARGSVNEGALEYEVSSESVAAAVAEGKESGKDGGRAAVGALWADGCSC